ncbi:hypothetical protein [Micromonospora aurantiaca]|uniref:hypothetical protein n=2 Tax=Micromonospora aurantiaca (nom. illeg.) TaxID=47850 RepID=UPI0037F40EAD
MNEEKMTATGRRGGSRRGFLAKIGVAGLVASGAVFARSTPAMAGNYQCCNLVYAPPNISYSTCSSATYKYIWYCSVNAYLHCNCCEKKTSSGTITGSGAHCQYN